MGERTYCEVWVRKDDESEDGDWLLFAESEGVNYGNVDNFAKAADKGLTFFGFYCGASGCFDGAQFLAAEGEPMLIVASGDSGEGYTIYNLDDPKEFEEAKLFDSRKKKLLAQVNPLLAKREET
jgi:hypothetical protein